jgi:predicted DNA-binding protein
MDKIFSARVDEATLARIEVLSRQLGKTKKRILEEAIEQYEKTAGEKFSLDILEQTSGAWKRQEPARETAARARKAFRASMPRNRR